MSLLLKALQNAAKNREAAASAAADSEPAPAATREGSAELSLEPVQPSARTQAGARSQAAAAEEATDRAPRPNQEHAQSVLRAGARPPPPAARQPGVFSWLARRPLVAFSTAAGVFAICYGLYLYLQISSPGMFIAQRTPSPRPPAPSPSIASAPSPVPPSPYAPAIAPSGSVPVPPAPPVAPPITGAAPAPSSTAGSLPQAAPAPVTPPQATPARVTPPVTPAIESGAQKPAAASTGTAPAVLPPPAAGPAAAPPASLQPSPGAGTRSEIASSPGSTPATSGIVAAAPRGDAVPASRARTARAAASPPLVRQPADGISSSGNRQVAAVDATLTNAYQALERGQLDDAERMYRQALAADARSVDAMLGLASTLTQQNKGDTASQLYMRVLEQEPRNAYAQAGLLSLTGRADPTAAEARLKQLIAREPSAFLYFTLGNLYSEQGQWAAAQGAYFQAHNMAPDNPDYAFNLAVGLEHLSQPRIALDYYRRAVALAQSRGHAQFELARVQTRIRSLETALERP